MKPNRSAMPRRSFSSASEPLLGMSTRSAMRNSQDTHGVASSRRVAKRTTRKCDDRQLRIMKVMAIVLIYLAGAVMGYELGRWFYFTFF